MPHSLRVRLKNLQRKGELTEKDIDRIFKALEQEPMREFTEEEAKAYSKALDKMYKPTGFNVFDEPCETCGYVEGSPFCLQYCPYDAERKKEQEPCEVEAAKLQQAYNKGFEDCRQAVLDGLASIAKVKARSDAQKSLMGRVMFFTEHLPSVTQKSKTGHWINLEKKYKVQVLPFWGRYGCSKCGGYGEGTFNYCPNCGARMESEV